jgi:hypothetical protein
MWHEREMGCKVPHFAAKNPPECVCIGRVFYLQRKLR